MSAWTVGRYMTVLPQFIAPDQRLIEAHKVMRSNLIRHLPVIDRGRLVGIVSMGDLHLMETLDPVDPEVDKVEDAMTPDPYVVAPDAPLEDVARTMAERKYGAAIVVDSAVRSRGSSPPSTPCGRCSTCLSTAARRSARAADGRRRAGGGRRSPRREPVVVGAAKSCDPLAMSWRERYAAKIATAEQAVRRDPARPAHPHRLGRRRAAPARRGAGRARRSPRRQRDRPPPDARARALRRSPASSDRFRHTAFFIGANVREAVQEGRADFMPVFLSDIPRAHPQRGACASTSRWSR